MPRHGGSCVTRALAPLAGATLLLSLVGILPPLASAESELFIPAEGRLALVDQDEAFGLSTELDQARLNPCRPIPADLRIDLMELNAEDLKDDLGDYLNAAQIDAILKRRDTVLELCGTPDS